MMSEIVITESVVIPVKPTEKGLLGFASCVINDSISLNSIAIYSRPNGEGYRLLYPIKVLPNGKEINIFYPINRETAEIINKAIFQKYEELMEKVVKENEKNETAP
ncbi:MAG: SpoVG family protein [Candidatus Omnitrophica bacterium]|nr:SpoVG family protein [Candidatus Omnitrophota bacterium]